MINLYEKYLKNASRKKNIFILTAENRLTLRNIPDNKICVKNEINPEGLNNFMLVFSYNKF